jgi:hypothetical protein
MYDRFFNRYVTPQMKKLSETFFAGWLLPCFFKFSAMGTILSACFFCQQVSIDHLYRITVSCHPDFLKKIMKITLKYLKICPGNPKFFRSITLNTPCSRPQSRNTVPLNICSTQWLPKFRQSDLPMIRSSEIVGWHEILDNRSLVAGWLL